LAASLERNDVTSASKAVASPPSIRCRLDLSAPGMRAATSHVEQLSSIAKWMTGSWSVVVEDMKWLPCQR
jgi:hypothetical protein